MRKAIYLAVTTLALALTGCGGGSATGNTAPVANAGPAQSVVQGSVVTLSGGASSDADGDTLTYSWTLSSQPAGSRAVLSSSSAMEPTYTADVAGIYVISLVVNDGTVSSAAVKVSVTTNTATIDTTPDNFSLVEQSGVPVSTTMTSWPVTIAGINAPAPISVTGGTYSIGCGAAFTPAVSTINNGQIVCVRHSSAATDSTTTSTTLTIGGVSGSYTSTTAAAADTTPNAFGFVDRPNVAVSTIMTSGPVTITGIDAAAPISVTNGSYSIGCGAFFTPADSTINNGQVVCVRHSSAATDSTTVSTTLTIGGVSDTYTTTTFVVTPPPRVAPL